MRYKRIFHINLSLSDCQMLPHYLVTGTTNNGGEHGARSIISGKASFHQSRAIVAHKGGGLVVVTHDVSWVSDEKLVVKR